MSIKIERDGDTVSVKVSEPLSDDSGIVLPQGKPYLDGIFGLTGPALRHVHMAAIIWRLAKDFGSTDLQAVEVGSWCGASTLTLAHAMARYNKNVGQVICIDAWKPYIDTKINLDEKYKRMQQALCNGQPIRVFNHNRQFVPKGISVNAICGWSTEILPMLPRERYHCIFIDGDHRYEAVRADIENSLPLVIDGGVICGDDLELQADECNTSIVNESPGIDYYYDVNAKKYFHPGVTRAVGERFGRVSAWHGVWAMRKHRGTWKSLSLQGRPFYCPPHIIGRDLIDLKLDILELNDW